MTHKVDGRVDDTHIYMYIYIQCIWDMVHIEHGI